MIEEIEEPSIYMDFGAWSQIPNSKLLINSEEDQKADYKCYWNIISPSVKLVPMEEIEKFEAGNYAISITKENACLSNLECQKIYNKIRDWYLYLKESQKYALTELFVQLQDEKKLREIVSLNLK